MPTAYEVAERLARERESVQLGIVEFCPVPVFVADRTGRWLSANVPMQTLLAVKEAKLCNDGWLGTVDPKMMRDLLAQWHDIFEKRPPKAKLRIHFITSDGRDFNSYTTLIRLTNESYIGFIIPACANPVNCPVHGFLLHNINGEADNLSNPSSGLKPPRRHSGSKGAESV